MNFIILFLVILLAFLLSSQNTKRNRLSVFLLLSSISLIIALRDNKVPDTEEYIASYLTDYDFFDFDNSSYEKGYTVFMRLCHIAFGEKYELFFFLFPFINFFIVSSACRMITNVYTSKQITNSFNIFILFVSYFSYFGLYHNAIVLRAGVATSLTLLSISFMLRHKSRLDVCRSLFTMVIAFLFHTSTLVCVPMLYVAYRTLNFGLNKVKFHLLIILCIYIVSPFLGLVMDPLNHLFLIIGNSNHAELSKFEYYNNTNIYAGAGISFKFVFFYIYAWVFALKKHSNSLWNVLLFMYLSGLYLWAILRPILWVERLSDFYMFIYVLMGMIYFQENKKKIIIRIALLGSIVIQLLFIYRIVNN